MLVLCFFFFFNDPATTEIYTLSLHDALPISLQADHRAVRQERVEQRAMAADRVHAQNHREARRALAPHEREPPRLGLRRGALAAATALARCLPARLHLLARPPVAADASEIAARSLVHLRALERVFQRSNFRFHLSNLL